MNRRQKIIVSVVGIFIVLLALVGLTYGYFLTRIQGNTNTRSITVTTADLRLIYNDGSDGVIGDELVEPSDTVFTKTFTVYNDGNVNIDYGVFLIDVINTFERKDDIKYSISCDSDGATCNGASNVTFPSGIASVVENTIEPQKTHTYTFSFSYKDTGTDQSVDMGKTLQAKIQIFGQNGDGTYTPHESNSLAYNILKNGAEITVLSGGEFDPNNGCGAPDLDTCISYQGMGCPSACIIQGSETKEIKVDTKIKDTANFNTVATGNSWDETTKSYTNDGLFKKEDDFGDSYYFRGPVTNNYVNFANMCWRIVRIEGDGSTKLILEDQDDLCEESDGYWDRDYVNFGFEVSSEYQMDITNYLNPSDDTLAMVKAFQNFQLNDLGTNISKLKAGNWCYNDSAYDANIDNILDSAKINKNDYYKTHTNFQYDSYVRVMNLDKYSPSLKCNGTLLENYNDGTAMYVGTITADEAVTAGLKYYTFDEYSDNVYLINKNMDFYTLTPSHTNLGYYESHFAFIINKKGTLTTNAVQNSDKYARPVISLKSNIPLADGIGTKTDPYDIN